MTKLTQLIDEKLKAIGDDPMIVGLPSLDPEQKQTLQALKVAVEALQWIKANDVDEGYYGSFHLESDEALTQIEAIMRGKK